MPTPTNSQLEVSSDYIQVTSPTHCRSQHINSVRYQPDWMEIPKYQKQLAKINQCWNLDFFEIVNLKACIKIAWRDIYTYNRSNRKSLREPEDIIYVITHLLFSRQDKASIWWYKSLALPGISTPRKNFAKPIILSPGSWKFETKDFWSSNDEQQRMCTKWTVPKHKFANIHSNFLRWRLQKQ